jgi:hypothetical protein
LLKPQMQLIRAAREAMFLLFHRWKRAGADDMGALSGTAIIYLGYNTGYYCIFRRCLIMLQNMQRWDRRA